MRQAKKHQGADRDPLFHHYWYWDGAQIQGFTISTGAASQFFFSMIRVKPAVTPNYYYVYYISIPVSFSLDQNLKTLLHQSADVRGSLLGLQTSADVSLFKDHDPTDLFVNSFMSELFPICIY